MKHVLSFIGLLIALDFIMVLFIMVQISHGIPTEHIPFWDVQIRFITSIFF